MQNFPDYEIFNDEIFYDERGYFIESYKNNKVYKKNSNPINFVQDNLVFSKKNVFRGLHFQIDPMAQSKLIRLIKGKIIDILLDIRSDSNNFLSWKSIVLEESKKQSLFIPQGFAHGYCVLSEEALVLYKVDNYYSKKHERFINIKNNKIKPNIYDSLKEEYIIKNLILSKKDQKKDDSLYDLKN